MFGKKKTTLYDIYKADYDKYMAEKNAPIIAKKKKRRRIITIIILVLLIAGGGAGFVWYSGGLSPAADNAAYLISKCVDSVENNVTDLVDSESKEESIELGDVTVTLMEASTTDEGNILLAPNDGWEWLILFFDIQNNSAESVLVDSFFETDCYVDDYSISPTLFSSVPDEIEGWGLLSGSVESGRKMRGYIVYEIPKGWNEFECNFAVGNENAQFIVSSKDVKKLSD